MATNLQHLQNEKKSKHIYPHRKIFFPNELPQLYWSDWFRYTMEYILKINIALRGMFNLIILDSLFVVTFLFYFFPLAPTTHSSHLYIPFSPLPQAKPTKTLTSPPSHPATFSSQPSSKNFMTKSMHTRHTTKTSALATRLSVIGSIRSKGKRWKSLKKWLRWRTWMIVVKINRLG
jgi:hypothetical protein